MPFFCYFVEIPDTTSMQSCSFHQRTRHPIEVKENKCVTMNFSHPKGLQVFSSDQPTKDTLPRHLILFLRVLLGNDCWQ